MDALMMFMLVFVMICSAVHHDPLIGMFIIFKWGFIVLTPISIALAVWARLASRNIVAEQEEEWRRRYPNAKPWNEFIKQFEEKKKMATLEEKMKQFETVERHECPDCANKWWFSEPEAWVCTTCAKTVGKTCVG